MLKMETKDFGTIEIMEKDIINFPRGLPGFLDRKEFVFLPAGEDSPFIIMQSREEKELAFVTLEPGNFIENYQFEIDDKTEEMLKLESMSDVTVFNIASIREESEDITINLAAPLVVNLQENLGRQVILDPEHFPVRYRVFSSKKKAESGVEE